MTWVVEYHEKYLEELEREAQAVRIAVAASAALLEQFGPHLRRPYVDTLKGSVFPNMKEIRITLPDGEWRVAFAFDRRRSAILLVGGSKSGGSHRKFYDRLLRVAERRFQEHMIRLKKLEL